MSDFNPTWLTKLDPAQEQMFRLWVKLYNVPWRDTQFSDYDMRGFFKAMIGGDPRAKQGANGHFPDVWKTPLHQSFSNESIYATKSAPHWVGKWLVSPEGKVVFKEK